MLPSLFGLAPCGVYPAAAITACAVRSYRTFSPLPDWPSRRTPFGPAYPRQSASDRRYVFCGTGRPRALTPASRTLSGTLPSGVRTFLSRKPLLAQRLPAATARSSCQCLVYREFGFTSCGKESWTKRPQRHQDILRSGLESRFFRAASRQPSWLQRSQQARNRAVRALGRIDIYTLQRGFKLLKWEYVT